MNVAELDVLYCQHIQLLVLQEAGILAHQRMDQWYNHWKMLLISIAFSFVTLGNIWKAEGVTKLYSNGGVKF